MMKLRPYHPADAETIVSWIRDEATMHRLAANLYDTFPVTPEEMNRKYDAYKLTHNSRSFVMVDERGRAAGHFVWLFRPDDPDTARLCFVIVDDSRRGQGLGGALVRLALQNAREERKARRVTLCVFANNPVAHRCYRKAGFRDLEPVRQVEIMGRKWDCIDMEVSWS